MGAIAFKVYAIYLDAAGSKLLVFLAFMLMIVAQVAIVYGDFWLSSWSSLTEEEQDEERRTGGFYHLKVYSALVATFLVLSFARSSVYMQLAINASQGLHDNAFRAIMQSPMR